MATPSSPYFVLKGGAFLLRLTPLHLWLTSSSLYGASPGAKFGREPDEVTGGVATQIPAAIRADSIPPSPLLRRTGIHCVRRCNKVWWLGSDRNKYKRRMGFFSVALCTFISVGPICSTNHKAGSRDDYVAYSVVVEAKSPTTYSIVYLSSDWIKERGASDHTEERRERVATKM
ncbi:hypothetical protein GW17_00020524 [Ensete ventricosum]|nr:hypothetical protein GW17_00020524 [Ensete ventricosum]RZR97804.1 hypothetical protein BHM03_00027046 [Ensete ventricosum]